jgi:hypothetical protein
MCDGDEQTYDVIFSGYCGMRWALVEDVDLEDARAAAAKKINKFRKSGREVTSLSEGEQWEFLTPDDAMMISDDEGVMTLKPAIKKGIGIPYV